MAEDAEPGPPGRRGRAVHERLRHHVALLAEPRVAPERTIRPAAQGAEQLHRVPGRPAELPAASESRRLRDGVHRQVAHGRGQRRPASGFRLLDEPSGQGNYFDNEFNIDGTRRRIEGYYTTVVTDHAVQWIGSAHEKPWLLVLGQKAPHGGPIQPEPRFAKAFDAFPVRTPVNYGATAPATASRPGSSRASARGMARRAALRPEAARHFVRTYLARCSRWTRASAGSMTRCARQVARRHRDRLHHRQRLRARRHGRVDKRTMYEESIRVPLLVRYPRAREGGDGEARW